MEDGNVRILIAINLKNNKIVGMITAYLNKHDNFTIDKSVKIDDVWVDSEYRKQGICKSLLKEIVVYYRQINSFTLNYVINNSEAEKTWKALGFKPIITQNIAKIEDLNI